MARHYEVGFDSVAVAAAQDLIEIAGPTDAVTQVPEIEISQNTELGDAQEEQLRLRWRRGIGSVTSGSGGTTATPQPYSDGDPAYGGVVEVNNTTKMVAGSGTIENFPEFTWNVRVEKMKVQVPEYLHEISPGNRLVLELIAAPTDSISMSLRCVLKEIGG